MNLKRWVKVSTFLMAALMALPVATLAKRV